MESRLNSHIWVEAHVKTCFLQDTPAFIVAKGDKERGGILLKVNRFGQGCFLYEQSTDFDGRRVWRQLGPTASEDMGQGEPEKDVDERIARKRQFDEDLWVLEIEDMRASYELDAPISRF